MTPIRRKKPLRRPWMRTFCKALQVSPTVSGACRKARISRKQAYEWRERDGVFAEAWEDAIESFYDELEAELGRRLKRSDRLLLFALQSYLPMKFGERAKPEALPLLVWDIPVPVASVQEATAS